MTEESLIGKQGTVTVAIDGIGKVQLKVGQQTSTYIAYANVPIPQGSRIVVYDDSRGGRRVDVEPI